MASKGKSGQKKGQMATDLIQPTLVERIKQAVSFSGLIDPSENDVKSLEKSINMIMKKSYDRTGEDSVNFLNLLYANIGSNKEANSKREAERKKVLVNLNDLIEGGQYSGVINDVFFSESERNALFDDYDKITNLIPEVGIIVSTYVDSIISPESFDNKFIQYTYSDNNDETKNAVEAKIKSIIEEHNLNYEIREIMNERIRRGESYVAVMNLEDVVSQALKEDVGVDKKPSNNEYEILTESYIDVPAVLSESTENSTPDIQFNKLIEEYNALINSELKLKSLNESAEAGTAPQAAKTLSAEEIVKNIGEMMSNSVKVEPGKALMKRKGKVVSGTIVYRLDVQRLVPIRTENDVCLGYYYIDYDHSKSFGKFSTTSKGMSPSVYSDMIASNNFTMNGMENMIDAKTRMISSIFANRIAKKLDREFIADNPQFKEVIFGLLKNNQRMKKTMSISYLPPEAVVQFGRPNDSVLKNVLFLSRLYLACLLSNFMQRIIQGSDKRIIYVDMGLDKDIPGAINRFARNIKTKEFKANDVNNINTVFQRVSTNQDIYIPTSNGKKPIDIEMMPSREISYNDEFLNDLKQMIFTGSGLPNELLAGSQAVDFAQSLDMRNARYLRKIIPISIEESKNLKSLILRIIGSDTRYSEATKENKSTKNKKVTKAVATPESEILSNIDVSKLDIGFSLPISMMAQAYADKISTFETYANFLAKITTGKDESAQDPEFIKLKQEIVMTYMKDIDWKLITTLHEKVKHDMKAEKISTGKNDVPAAADATADDESGGMF